MPSDITIKYYNQLYNKLLKNGFDPTKDHYNNCMKILDNLNLKSSSRSNYCKCLLFKNNENIICLTEDDKKNISNFFNATNKKYCDIVDKHQKLEYQEKNYLEWNEILKLYDQIMTKDNNEQNKLLISFYVLLPPRRIDDYRHLYLTKSKPRKMDNNKNYLVYIKQPYLLFNNYKTNTTYKTQKILVPKKLKLLLDEYIKHMKNDKVFLYSDNTFKNIIFIIFKKYVSDKRISVNILRHSFISHQKFKNLKQRKKTAYKMAHSINLQLQYHKN